MQNKIYLVGLNHRTAGVEIRERFALSDHLSYENWGITHPEASEHLQEALILSTCNRVEILGIGDAHIPELILESWAKTKGFRVEDLRPYTYVHQDKEAITHLFKVASSLDSMILGEPQILGQLKDAYRKAVDAKAGKTIVNRLLHKSFSVAKKVRSQTGVASNAVSISYAAVELAKRIFDDMNQYQAMLIGAGEMAELAASHLLQAGIKHIYVVNRTPARAQDLARKFNGTALPYEQLLQGLTQVDIVISSTGAPDPILKLQDLTPILQQRKNKPMFFIDIAVPRDIDPSINSLDNVYLYDIDDLREVVEENLATRREEATKAMHIVDAEVEEFTAWMESLALQPTIMYLRNTLNSLANDELERTLKRLKNQDPVLKESLEAMLASLINKISHHPISYLKNEHDLTDTRRIATIRRVFGLDVE